MPNEGDLEHTSRTLLASLVTSVLTYGIAIWADTQSLFVILSALRVVSSFVKVSKEAVCVIGCLQSIEVLAENEKLFGMLE